MPAKSSPPVAPWIRLAGGALLLLGLAFVLYWPALRGEFLWDDDVLITENPLLHENGGLGRIWFSTEAHDYFPLTLTSLWCDWQLWRLETVGYHVGNVLLHVLGACLFWRVLQRLKMPGAFVAAAVFLVHPVNVSSVAWIAERKNVLSLAFFLLALLWFLRSEAEEEKAAGQEAKWYWLSLAAFLLALLSKTSVVMLPVLLLGIFWWRHGRITGANLLKTAPFFLLSLALGLVTVWFQSHRAIGAGSATEPLTRLASGGWSVWFYFYKDLLPLNLSMIYPRWEISGASPLAWLPWILWLAALGTLWAFRKTWGRAGFFFAACFFVPLLPVLGFFDMAFFASAWAADHLQQLALLAVAAAAGVLTARLWQKKGAAPLTADGVHWTPPALVLIALLAFLGWQRAAVFASSENLWSDTLRQNNRSWVAHNNFGSARAANGDLTTALSHFQAAVDLKTNYVEAWNNLGSVYSDLGDPAKAEAAFRQALAIDPDHDAAELNWGLLLGKAGRLPEAAEHFENILKHIPDHAPANYNLGVTYLQMNRLTLAVTHLRAALKTRPDFPQAQAALEAAENGGGAPGAP